MWSLVFSEFERNGGHAELGKGEQQNLKYKGKEAVTGLGREALAETREKKSQTPQPGIEPGNISKHGWCYTTELTGQTTSCFSATTKSAFLFSPHQDLCFGVWVVRLELLEVFHLLLQREELSLELIAQLRQSLADVVGKLLENEREEKEGGCDKQIGCAKKENKCIILAL